MGLIPNFSDNYCAFFWCYPRHLKKQMKLTNVNSKQNKARPIQNMLIVNRFMITIIAQNTTAIICEIQNTETFKVWGTREGFLD